MIVQSAETNDAHFVICQTDHAAVSAELARAFGNERFAPLDPADLMAFVVAHHDDGWSELDAQWLQDPATGLPYNLVKTPLDKLVRTGSGSPDVNEAHHPFCGIISSMHTYGLYHGRYGLSSFMFIDLMPEELQPYVEKMLANELQRQERLKTQLSAEQSSDQFLFHNYKLLQFFDTLALYFQTMHPEARIEATFENVPRALGDDVSIELRPKSGTHFMLDPWPFSAETVEVSTAGRYLRPQPQSGNLREIAQLAPICHQAVIFSKS